MTEQHRNMSPEDLAARKAAQRRNNWRLGIVLFLVAAFFFASAIVQQLRAH
jgi:hypothetical protein